MTLLTLLALVYSTTDNLPEINKVLPKEQAKVATTLWNKEDDGSKPKAIKLNSYQIDAIRLACSNDLVMIQGPPGVCYA